MNSKIVLLFLVLLISFGGCKKYEEGPKFITFRSVKGRLTNGDWELKELISGGVNQTQSYKQIKFNLSFSVNSNFSTRDFLCNLTYTYDGGLLTGAGYVGFLNKGDDMNLQLYYNDPYQDPNYYPDFFYIDSNYEYPVWHIVKLTNKELWMETTVDGVVTSMKLTKK